MRKRRIALLAAGVTLVALAVNTTIVELDTEPATPDFDGGVLELPAGDVHIKAQGPVGGPPVVLVHGFQASMRWWDGVARILAREHRVIRMDLLGHGASEKPRKGYSMEEQGDLVAAVMDDLKVERAAVVGHSMGGQVVTALAERHREKVGRLMVVGTAPENRFSKNRAAQRIAALPVVGHTLRRLLPDRAYDRQVDLAFRDDTDVPDELYDDPHRATFTSFRESRDATVDYRAEKPLDVRLEKTGIRLHVIFGAEDELVDSKGALEWDVPGVRIAVLPGHGHSPQVEDPEKMARLIADFARVRGDL